MARQHAYLLVRCQPPHHLHLYQLSPFSFASDAACHSVTCRTFPSQLLCLSGSSSQPNTSSAISLCSVILPKLLLQPHCITRTCSHRTLTAFQHRSASSCLGASQTSSFPPSWVLNIAADFFKQLSDLASLDLLEHDFIFAELHASYYTLTCRS